MNFAFSSLSFFSDQPWSIPVIGLLVASLAFLMGRRWMVPRPAPESEPQAEDAVNQYLASRGKKSDPERRACPRRKAGNRVEVFLADESKQPQLFGWVIDRSMGGLCLNVEKPLSQGTILNVRPRNAPQTMPWIPIEIRSCRPEGNEWEIGCRFLNPPPWNELMIFG